MWGQKEQRQQANQFQSKSREDAGEQVNPHAWTSTCEPDAGVFLQSLADVSWRRPPTHVGEMGRVMKRYHLKWAVVTLWSAKSRGSCRRSSEVLPSVGEETSAAAILLRGAPSQQGGLPVPRPGCWSRVLLHGCWGLFTAPEGVKNGRQDWKHI